MDIATVLTSQSKGVAAVAVPKPTPNPVAHIAAIKTIAIIDFFIAIFPPFLLIISVALISEDNFFISLSPPSLIILFVTAHALTASLFNHSLLTIPSPPQ